MHPVASAQRRRCGHALAVEVGAVGRPQVFQQVVAVPVDDAGVEIRATVRTADRTGIEMEALTAVAVAALALVDMVKAVDRHARITEIRVTAKSGGRSGDWREPGS